MDKREFDKRFTYHPPKDDQPQRYEEIRAAAREFALTICDLVPDSKEKEKAITYIESATMWANAAIARNE